MNRPSSARNKPGSRVKQYDVVLLSEDINPKMKSGTKVIILEIYENGDFFEVEAVKKDGTSVTHKDISTFTVSRNQIKQLK